MEALSKLPAIREQNRDTGEAPGDAMAAAADASRAAGESRIEDVYKNYDAVFKDAVAVFKDKAADFFGLDKGVLILEPLRTEKAEVTVDVEFSDLTFRLSDGRGLHLEAEAAISQDDMLRFCGYHVDLVRIYKCEFVTAILVRDDTGPTSIDHSMLKFTPQILRHADYDADAKLAEMHRQIEAGGPVNELELVFLPLFRSTKHSPEELLKETVVCAQKLQIPEDQKLKLVAMAIIVSNKIVDNQILDNIWEEVRIMKLKLMELAEEKFKEQGIAQGVEQGVAQGAEQERQALADYIADLIKRGLSSEEVLTMINERLKAQQPAEPAQPQ